MAAALPLALALSGGIALTAWRFRSLSLSGAAAATAVGTLAMMAGPAWGVFLVVWFVSASLASKLGQRAKALATGDVVDKGGPRDALQVVANGGVFALAAAASLLHPEWATVGAMIGAAALVGAGADTFATETGTLYKGHPWSLRSFGPVPTGTSGAVSLPGTAGMFLGAFLLALAARATGLIATADVWAVGTAGICGAVADTLVGAWWQARRWCPSCDRETEQQVHRCGTTTSPWRGVAWLSNDVVNFACTVVAAAVMWGLR